MTSRSPMKFWAQVGDPKRKAIKIKGIHGGRRGSFAHKLLIPRKLLICRLAELASIDWQSRYSNSAIWQRAPSRSRPSPHKAFCSSWPQLSATSSPETRLSRWAMTPSKAGETAEIRFVENGERASNLRCVEQPTPRTQRGSGGPMVKA